jgi:hypothetical protein
MVADMSYHISKVIILRSGTSPSHNGIIIHVIGTY